MRKKLVIKADDIQKDWREWLVVLWVEDDCSPDSERLSQAFLRITGFNSIVKPIHIVDEDDCETRFYQRGWVQIVACDYGAVAILVDDWQV